jgi:hypothetical protein
LQTERNATIRGIGEKHRKTQKRGIADLCGFAETERPEEAMNAGVIVGVTPKAKPPS